MKISIIGTGTVGQTLAVKIISAGHEVMIGTRNVSEKLASQVKDGYGNPSFAEWHETNPQVKLGTFAEAGAFGEIIFNATHGASSTAALKLANAKNLEGKVLVDVSNPLDFSKGMPPSLIPSMSNYNSLGEEIQKAFPGAKVVKTLNTMWCGVMVNPSMINNGDHANFICGNDESAKQKVKSLLNDFGWKNENIIDLGDITASRGMEGILPLWLRIMVTSKSGAFNFKIVR